MSGVLRPPLAGLALLLLSLGICAQDAEKKDDKDDKEEKFISGPQVDSPLPGPCEVFNINGPIGMGRYHCLVCEYSADPVVMIFAREPAEGKDGPLNSLIQKLEEAIPKNDKSQLHAFVVFLSPGARSSATEKKIEDTDKLVEEAAAREALHARLKARAKDLKSVVIACTIPEGPKKYNINPRADVTVVFYKKLKVLDNYAFTEGKMSDDDAAMIVDKVEKTLRDAKKKPAKKS